MVPLLLLILAVGQCHTFVSAANRAQAPAVTAAPKIGLRNATLIVQERQTGRQTGMDVAARDITTEFYTIFQSGDISKPRTANSGFDCRVDVLNGLWGFCPNTVIAATDCGLAGSCIDSHACSDGCGFTDSADLTTFTCAQSQYCSTALLTLDNEEGPFTYIACGGGPFTDHYNALPTRVILETSSSEPTSSSPASTSTASTLSSSSAAPSSTSAAPGQTSAPTTVSTDGLGPLSPTSAATTDITAAATSASSAKGGGGGNNNTGAIVGGVVGCVALLCGFGIAVVYILRRGRARRHSIAPPDFGSAPGAAEYYSKDTYHVNGGWGPRELPAHGVYELPREPVELPTYGT